MPEPVRDVEEIESFIRRVDTPRVAERVRMASVRGKLRRERIPPEQVVDHGRRQRRIRPAAWEEIRIFVLASLAEVRAKKPQRHRMEAVHPRFAALQPRHANTAVAAE